MPFNQVVYFPNPLTSKTTGTQISASLSGTTILYTLGTNESKKISAFTISFYIAGTPNTDYSSLVLKLGNAYYSFIANSSSTVTNTVITSSSIGFQGAWLQTGDSISLISVKNGNPIGTINVAVTMDEYNA